MAHKLYREAHPMPFVITHWINVLAMLFLTLSGLYIHYPIFPGFMGVARGTHFFWMFVLCINLTLRIILAFFVKSAVMPDTREQETDIKNWLPQEANRHQMLPWVKYYLFLKKDHPIFAAYTGFALWAPTSDWAFFAAGTAFFADLFNAGGGGGDPMAIRIVHYWTMWLILIFTAAHVYLANIYNFAPSRMIFAWKESDEH
jgi:Ni/Fe-hydrogenase 1 B-type cytochrome subunit